MEEEIEVYTDDELKNFLMAYINDTDQWQQFYTHAVNQLGADRDRIKQSTK